MAVYHLTVKPVSRKAGRSSTASAAYRSATLIYDRTTGETFDYRRRRGVEYAEIVLSSVAAKRDINWARDRQELWNRAEIAERRSNSRVAREYEMSLPHELNKAQRQTLGREFAQQIAERYGCAVDFAMHTPHPHGDRRNYHVHLLATTRTIEPGGLGEKTTIEWSDTNRRRAGLEPAAQEIDHVRALWEGLVNERLKALGIEARIDRRSLEAQGIEREPTTHLGPKVSAIERRGGRSEVIERIAEQTKEHEQTRALEHARLERESRQIESAILDLSGDLHAALNERDRQRSATKAKTPAVGKSVAELQREGREQWLAMRAAAKAAEAERGRALAPQVDLAMQNLRLGRVIETPALVAWRETMAAKPIEHQAQILEAIERRLQLARSERLARVREHVLARSARRERAVQAVYAREPKPPAGLLAGLRRRAYEESHRAWQVEERRQERLREQARALDQALAIAADPVNLGRRARQFMRERDPALVERVNTYVQRQRALERERSRTLERGRDRDFDLSR